MFDLNQKYVSLQNKLHLYVTIKQYCCFATELFNPYQQEFNTKNI